MLNRNPSQSRRGTIAPAQIFESSVQRAANAKVFRGENVQNLFLNEVQVAEIIGASVATVRRWRLIGRGPKFLKVGGTLIRYPVEELETWLASQPSGGGAK